MTGLEVDGRRADQRVAAVEEASREGVMWPLLSVVARGNPSLWIASREGVIWPLLSVVTRGNPSLWVASREGDRKRGGWHSRVVVVQQRLGVHGNITQGDDVARWWAGVSQNK